MKIGLIKWFFKDEALTQTVRDYRSKNREASLKLPSAELQNTAEAIYNKHFLQEDGKDGWFKDSHVGAIKSTLRQLMREDRAIKITGLVANGDQFLPIEGIPTDGRDQLKLTAKNIFTAGKITGKRGKDVDLSGLTEKDIFLTLLNLDKIRSALRKDRVLLPRDTLTYEDKINIQKIAKPMIRRFDALQTTFQTGFAESTIKQYDAYLKTCLETLRRDLSEDLLLDFASDQTTVAKKNPELPLMLVSDVVFTLKDNFTETEMNQLMKNLIPPAHLVNRMTKLLEDKSFNDKLKVFANILWQIPRIKETLSATEMEFLNWMRSIFPKTVAQTNVTRANGQNGYDETTINRYATYLTIPRSSSLEDRLKNFAEADRVEVAQQFPKLDKMLVDDLALALRLNYTKKELSELVTLLKCIIEKNNNYVNTRTLEQVRQSFSWGYDVIASLYGVEGMVEIPVKLGKLIKLLEDSSFKNKMNIFSTIQSEKPDITNLLSDAETELLNLCKKMLSN